MINIWGIFIGLMFVTLGLGIIFGYDVWHYIWPIFLILLGVSILYKHSFQKPFRMNEQITHESSLDYSIVFSGEEKKIVTDSFAGGKIAAVFGGTTIDLRNSKIKQKTPIQLEVSAVFGGVKVIVPRTWLVQGSLTGVFGGFRNSTTIPEKPEGTISLKGAAVFGGGDIINE